MDVIRDIIYTQNKDLLCRIANDMYNDECEKIEFIKKYHKKNFTYLQTVKKDPIKKHIIYIKKRVL